MASPRRGRDFSNINNMAKKKGSKQRKNQHIQQNTERSSTLEDFQKESLARRVDQLLKGNATEPHDVVFQSTQAFEHGTNTLATIKLKHQSLEIESSQELPFLFGQSVEDTKAERFSIYAKKSSNGRFGKALKLELDKTKHALIKNNKKISPENIFQEQRKQSIDQKKKAAEEKDQRRVRESKLITEEKPVLHQRKRTMESAQKETLLPLEEAIHDYNASKPESSRKNPNQNPGPIVPEEKVSAIKATSEDRIATKNLQKTPPHLETSKSIKRNPLFRFLKAIVRFFSPSKKPLQSGSKSKDSRLKIKNVSQPIHSQKLIFSEQEPQESDVDVVEEKQPETSKVELFKQTEVTEDIEVNETNEPKEPLEIDPLELVRAQQPVYLGPLRNHLRASENPVLRMTQMMVESDPDLSEDRAQSLIDYVATPWALMAEINYQSRLEFLKSMRHRNSEESTKPKSETIDLAFQSLNITIDRELLDLLFEIIEPRATLNEAEWVEIVDDFSRAYPNQHIPIVLSHILGRIQVITSEWYTHASVGEYEDICANNMHYMREKFNQKQIEWASEIFSAFALEHPAKVKSQFSLRRHKYSRTFELTVERWVDKHLPDQNYITEDNLKITKLQKFGVHTLRPRKKSPHIRNTPDILFANPVRLQGHDSNILWIDAKLAMYDPAFTQEEKMKTLLNQMERYVKAYGPGLMVWGKPFSQEWNERTQPAISHTTMKEFV
jgi:hypothetical protein